jgi:hypothetical protein
MGFSEKIRKEWIDHLVFSFVGHSDGVKNQGTDIFGKSMDLKQKKVPRHPFSHPGQT